MCRLIVLYKCNRYTRSLLHHFHPILYNNSLFLCELILMKYPKFASFRYLGGMDNLSFSENLLPVLSRKPANETFDEFWSSSFSYDNIFPENPQKLRELFQYPERITHDDQVCIQIFSILNTVYFQTGVNWYRNNSIGLAIPSFPLLGAIK